jgi:multisubunit Na+/H+ antiporter MnhE subunit
VNRRAAFLGTGEVLVWWAALALPWLIFIRAVTTRELVLGASAALVGAFAAWGTRWAVRGW